MTVTVGCSGWSYDDWVGRFFPFEMRDDNAKRFEHYAEFFNSVEVNSTFYRMPVNKQVDSWVEKAKAHPGFEFSAKMPRSVTHEALVNGDDKEAVRHALFFERILALPLNEAGGLGAILLQMSPYFHNTSDSFEVLSRFLGSLSVGEFHYALEFRNRSWLSEKHHLIPEAARLLRDNRIANVIVDGPGSHSPASSPLIPPTFVSMGAITTPGIMTRRRTTSASTGTITFTQRNNLSHGFPGSKRWSKRYRGCGFSSTIMGGPNRPRTPSS